jgi:hypothetical protein
MTAKNTRYRCISKILEVAKEELNQIWQCTGKNTSQRIIIHGNIIKRT